MGRGAPGGARGGVFENGSSDRRAGLAPGHGIPSKRPTGPLGHWKKQNGFTVRPRLKAATA